MDPWVGTIPLEEEMATHSNILAWRVPMDRRAWRATVHGGAKVTERLAQHSTLCYRSSLCAFDSTLCFPEDPRGKLGSLQLLIELNQWAAFGEWARGEAGWFTVLSSSRHGRGGGHAPRGSSPGG